MAYNDFREFLDALKKSGDLLEVNRPISLETEVGQALKKNYAKNGPAIIFNNTGKKFPLVAGVYGNRDRALLAFETTEDKVFDKVLDGLAKPIDPVIVKEALCHEVVLTGTDIDITEFPVPKYSPVDGGPYITPAISVSKDPETGIADIGHYRFQVMGKDTLSFMAQPFHRFGKNMNKAIAQGKKCFEGALVIGVDPVLAYTCQVQVADDTDDWSVAGGLRGKAVELVKCKTIDLEVPATAEVVIEFVVDLDNGPQIMEGPLGEYTGYYTPASPKPVARITAITHRQNPYFQGLLTGKPTTENHVLKQLPFEASFYQTMKKQFPTIDKICIPPSGGVSFYVVISMKPRYAGEVRQTIMAAMASNIRPKWVIVVDPDINVRDSNEVEWALSFRVRPAEDIVIVDQVPAGPLDPSSGDAKSLAKRVNSTIGIDATRPFDKDFAQVADVPGWREYDFPEIEK
jgi:4-hydroxy-3-polyprenylbenzoate decarboxylase/2,5-furandicarboxylate decarboxylase 1